MSAESPTLSYGSRDPITELFLNQIRIQSSVIRKEGDVDRANTLDEKYGAAAMVYKRTTGYDLIANFDPSADPSFGESLVALANLDISSASDEETVTTL